MHFVQCSRDAGVRP